jgi:hypothetical protein
VGSLAVDGGDRFSDLDLAFGIADGVPVTEVLGVWTTTLIDELDALHAALAASVMALMKEGAHAALPSADVVAERLAEAVNTMTNPTREAAQ